MQRLLLSHLNNTKAFAAKLAPQLIPGDIVFLAGDLGAGKTTFAQFLIHALAGEEVEVTSPTFTLLQTYPLPEGGELYHYDLYRVEHESALTELGFEEALENITLIEWPQRLGRYPLAPTLVLLFAIGSDESRTVTIHYAREGIAL